MGNIKKFITMAGLLLVVFGCGGLVATLVFLVQLIYDPTHVPIIKTIISNVQTGETMTALFKDTPLSIKITSNLKDIIVAVIGILIVGTAASVFKTAIDAGRSMLRLTRATQPVIEPDTVDVTPQPPYNNEETSPNPSQKAYSKTPNLITPEDELAIMHLEDPAGYRTKHQFGLARPYNFPPPGSIQPQPSPTTIPISNGQGNTSETAANSISHKESAESATDKIIQAITKKLKAVWDKAPGSWN